MNKAIFLVLGIVAVLIVSGCIQTGQVTVIGNGNGDSNQSPAIECPDSCSDGNSCTTDFCSEKTDFKCQNQPLSDISCGENGVCVEGTCVEIKDDCSYVYEDDKLTSAEKEKEAERCYQRNYIGPAKAEDDTRKCNGILRPNFLSLCYATVALDANDPTICDVAEDVPIRDGCYFDYASSKANLFIFAGEACINIIDQKIRKGCMDFEDYVTEPIGIKSFYVAIVGDRIVSYITLKDRKDRTAVAEGNLTVYIKQETILGEEDKRLYFETFEVKEGDFKLTSLSGFGEEDIAYVIGPIMADDLVEYPTENYGTFYVTFYTTDGKSFFASKELRF